MKNWSKFLREKQNKLIEIQQFSSSNSPDYEEYTERLRPVLLSLLQLH
jgi:hypothetical protein